MHRHLVQLLLVVVLAISAPACATRIVPPPPTVNPAGDEELSRVAAAVSKVLTSDAVPDGVRLLAVHRRTNGSITLDLSDELLVGTSDEDLDEIVKQVLMAASSARSGTGSQDSFVVLVDGVLLDSYRSVK